MDAKATTQARETYIQGRHAAVVFVVFQVKDVHMVPDCHSRPLARGADAQACSFGGNLLCSKLLRLLLREGLVGQLQLLGQVLQLCSDLEGHQNLENAAGLAIA